METSGLRRSSHRVSTRQNEAWTPRLPYPAASHGGLEALRRIHEWPPDLPRLSSTSGTRPLDPLRRIGASRVSLPPHLRTPKSRARRGPPGAVLDTARAGRAPSRSSGSGLPSSASPLGKRPRRATLQPPWGAIMSTTLKTIFDAKRMCSLDAISRRRFRECLPTMHYVTN
jgi:hypothetical protein